MMLLGLVVLLAVAVVGGGAWAMLRWQHLEDDPGPSVLRDWAQERERGRVGAGG